MLDCCGGRREAAKMETEAGNKLTCCLSVLLKLSGVHFLISFHRNLVTVPCWSTSSGRTKFSLGILMIMRSIVVKMLRMRTVVQNHDDDKNDGNSGSSDGGDGRVDEGKSTFFLGIAFNPVF